MKIQVINELNNDPVLIIFDNAKTKKFSVAKDQLLGDTNLIAEQLRECARELVNYRTEKSERYKANELGNRNREIGGRKMKYFETKEPYYSLIVANNADEAKKIYREMYGDQDDPEQFKELSREEALYTLAIAKTEDGYILAYEDVQKSLNEKAPSMLLVDHLIL